MSTEKTKTGLVEATIAPQKAGGGVLTKDIVETKGAPSPLASGTQIASVTNVETLDRHARENLTPQVKLRLLAEEAKATFGQDPRGGGFVFVARPRVLLQLLMDFDAKSLGTEIRLQRAVIIGSSNDDAADVIGWWQDIPIVVRCTVSDDKLHCVSRQTLPQSQAIDRKRAGQMRVAAHNDGLERLKEQNS